MLYICARNKTRLYTQTFNDKHKETLESSQESKTSGQKEKSFPDYPFTSTAFVFNHLNVFPIKINLNFF